MIARPTEAKRPTPELRNLAVQAESISRQIESGQAIAPCSELFRRLTEASLASVPHLSIVCLSPSVREEIEAYYRNSHAPSSSRIETTRFGVRIREAAYDLEVAVLSDLVPALGAWLTFCESPRWLMVVGEANATLTESQREVLDQLVNLFPVVIPCPQGTSCEQNPWWRAPAFPHRTGTSSEPLTRPIGDILRHLSQHRGETMVIVEHVSEQQQVQWLHTSIQALVARSQRETQRIKDELLLFDQPARIPSNRPVQNEKDFVKFRENLTHGLGKIEKDLCLKMERSLQPLGQWTCLLREITSSLQVDSLDRSQNSSTIKLGVSASHLAKVNRKIEHALHQELLADLQQVNRRVRKLAYSTFSQIALDSPFASATKFPSLKEQGIWSAVENLLAIGKESHIELTRRGIFDVLTAGRQKVFMVIMFVSLMGRMGLPNLFQSTGSKTAFGLFMAGIMISSMVSSILSWKRENAAQSERELTKIRETLFNDACKVIEQAEKAKLAAVREFFKELVTDLEGMAKIRLEEQIGLQKATGDEELRRREQAKRGLEQRAKSMVEIDRQLPKLAEAASGLVELTQSRLPSLLVAWTQAFEVEDQVTRVAGLTESLPSTNIQTEPLNVSCSPNRVAVASPTNVDSSNKPATSRLSGMAERRLRRLEQSKTTG